MRRRPANKSPATHHSESETTAAKPNAVRKTRPSWTGPCAREAKDAASPNATVEVEGDRIWIRHAPVSQGWGYIMPDVMTEFGARSTGLPIDTLTVTCDAAADLPEIDFSIAASRVMRAERTFWEKATAVNVFCAQGRLGAERLARH